MRFAYLALLVSPVVVVAQVRGSLPLSPPVEVQRVTITKPTVVAFLVVPNGAVDTLPDLAVIAEDWNYGMATLGDSLRRSVLFASDTSSAVASGHAAVDNSWRRVNFVPCR
jgi:hypothetical protein